jgi:preprotein translocase SecE subunit
LAGLGVFLFLQLREKTRIWAHEVVVEVRKVVWPSRQATLGMTVLVCIILMISGFVLGVFDLASNAVVNFIID